MAGIRPKFVVSMTVAEPEGGYQVPGSEVRLPVQTVVTFAIDSVVKLFIESDILGREYNLRIDSELINGRNTYFLRLA